MLVDLLWDVLALQSGGCCCDYCKFYEHHISADPCQFGKTNAVNRRTRHMQVRR
jgi:hypothetical protein